MTHNEKRTVWWKEGILGLSTGVMYGLTSVAIGHPFDTVKTKMQAQVQYQNSSMINAFSTVLKTQGVKGLYAGCVAPMWGSGLYRSIQFAVYEALYTKWSHTHTLTPQNNNTPPLSETAVPPVALPGSFQQLMLKEIPHTGGVQVRVLAGGFCASAARALVETPIEYAKVAGQTQQSWQLSKVYTGLTLTFYRTLGVLGTYFVIIDSVRRHRPDVFKTTAGQFLTASCASTSCFILYWPLEVLKNQVQANTPTDGQGGQSGARTQSANVSVLERARNVVKHQGIAGLYRGIAPGVCRSFIANGSSMVVMIWAQKQATRLGLRD